MSKAAYTNLMKARNTKSGIAEYAWLAFANDFATINYPVQTEGTSKEDRYTIKVPHVFKDASNKFMKFKLLPGKNSLAMQSSGDAGSQRVASTVTIFIPGSYKEAHATICDMNNEPLIVLVKDADCGANQYYQLGSECAGAYLTCDFQTGTTQDGVKGYQATITYPDNFVYYEVENGPDTLADGESTPVDGEPADPEA